MGGAGGAPKCRESPHGNSRSSFSPRRNSYVAIRLACQRGRDRAQTSQKARNCCGAGDRNRCRQRSYQAHSHPGPRLWRMDRSGRPVCPISETAARHRMRTALTMPGDMPSSAAHARVRYRVMDAAAALPKRPGRGQSRSPRIPPPGVRPVSEAAQRRSPEVSVVPAAALDQPIDAITNRQDRKTRAGNWPGRSPDMARRAGAVPIAIAGFRGRTNRRQGKGQNCGGYARADLHLISPCILVCGINTITGD